MTSTTATPFNPTSFDFDHDEALDFIASFIEEVIGPDGEDFIDHLSSEYLEGVIKDRFTNFPITEEDSPDREKRAIALALRLVIEYVGYELRVIRKQF